MERRVRGGAARLLVVGLAATSACAVYRARPVDPAGLPNEPRAAKLHARGAELCGEGRFAEAIPELTRAAEIEPGSASIQHLLGAAYFYQGSMEASEVALHRAIAANPTHVRTHASMGYTLYALGRFEEAGRAFEWVSAMKGWKDAGILQALALLRPGGASADEARRVVAGWMNPTPAPVGGGGDPRSSAAVDDPRRTLGSYLLGVAKAEDVARAAWPDAHWRTLADFVVAAGAISLREEARARESLERFLATPAPDRWALTLQRLAASELERMRGAPADPWIDERPAG